MPPDVLGLLLDLLADRLAARLGSPLEREHYSSRALPPRTTRRRFAELCRSGGVLDARREGQDWTCPRAAWEAARARRPARRDVAPAEPAPLAERADALLARAGLRVVRGPR